jgi:cytidylate kinase
VNERPSGALGVRVVTISATYGSGGSVIAPRLAERLGLPFADRLLPAADVAARVAATEHLSEEERTQTARSGLLDRLAHVTSGLGMPIPNPVDLGGGVREQVEASIAGLVAAGGAVVLGRAGAVVLAGNRRAYHVRLDGPEARRVARGMAIQHLDEREARARMTEADRARTRYVSRLYGRDSSDPRLYHLMLDTTVLPDDVCVALLATAAEAFWARPRDAGG